MWEKLHEELFGIFELYGSKKEGEGVSVQTGRSTGTAQPVDSTFLDIN